MAQYSPFSVSAKRQKKGPAQPIKSIWELLYHKGTSVSTLAEKLGETAHRAPQISDQSKNSTNKPPVCDWYSWAQVIFTSYPISDIMVILFVRCFCSMKNCTLCYIENENQEYLMLHRIKKLHDVNQDKWIGVGGKFERDESPDECLLREVWEETGLTLTSYRFRGVVTFVASGWETEYMSLYTADRYIGTLKDCDEGNLEWVPKEKVFDLPIWEGDKFFFRLLEEDQPFFSLKLVYENDRLTGAALNGETIDL